MTATPPIFSGLSWPVFCSVKERGGSFWSSLLEKAKNWAPKEAILAEMCQEKDKPVRTIGTKQLKNVCLSMAFGSFISCGDNTTTNDGDPKKSSYFAMTTLYTTENTAMEGGPLDRCGKRLGSLEQYIAGQVSFVSVAMDKNAFPYGTILIIPEIDKKLGKKILFKVVDTGGAFIGRGTNRMDICVGNSQSDIYSKTYGWISRKTFNFLVVSRGDSYQCR